MTSLTTAPAEPTTTPDGPRRDRLLGLAGLGFVVALLPVVVIPHASLDYPVDRPPAGRVVTAFFEHHQALEQWQALMHSLAGVAFLVFGAALAAQVRRHQRPGSAAAGLVLAGAAVTAAVMVVTMALVSGAVSQVGGVDGVTLGWVYDLGWWVHFKALYAVPLVLLPAVGVLPRALGAAGAVVAVVALAAMVGALSAGTAFLQFPAFFLLMLWVLVTAVVALTRGVGTRPARGGGRAG